jgi:hypothetical protein
MQYLKARLVLDVDFEKGFTPQEIADALDTLLETSLSTTDVLSDVGNPTVDSFTVMDSNKALELADQLEVLMGVPADGLGGKEESLQPVVDFLREIAGSPDVCPSCGKPYREFVHNCKECVDMPEVYGCPVHDDSCPFCRGEE